MRTSSWVVLLAALAAAPAAFGAEATPPSPMADPFGPRAVFVPESLAVVPRDAWRGRASAGEGAVATLAGGPRGSAPAPCGPCRQGYDDCGHPRWGGNVWLGFWLWGQTGTAGADGQESDVDTSLSDSLDVFEKYGDSAFTGGARLDYGRWFLRGWLSYLRLAADDATPTGEPIEVTVKGLVAEIGAGYRVAEVSLGCGPCSPCLALEPWLGVRHAGMEFQVDALQTHDERDRSWWDPMVGCAFQFDFRNGWLASVEGSVGGFGLSSDFAWGLRGQVTYMFTRHVGVFAGIAAIGWDYEDDGFTFDVTQWGPYGGLVFAF